MASNIAPVKILPLGDSHTYGMVSSTNDREAGGYRLYLDKKLKEAGLTFDMVGRQRNGPTTFDRDHEGYSGHQIDALAAKVPDMIKATRPDVVLLMAGNNDTKTDTVAKMKSDMNHLIDTLSAHAPDAQILVAGLPPARPDNTSGANPAKIAAFNAELPGLIAAKKAAGVKVGFVDTSSLTLNDISGLNVDAGVHLSHAGAQKLAGIWLNALKSLGVKDGTIDHGGSTTPPPTSGDGSGGSVTAVDDAMWKTSAGETMWQNARYLTWNDKGTGELKVTAVATKSAAGGNVSFGSDGTIVYKPVAGWQGNDSVQYTVKDATGATDTGTFHVQVGKGGTTPPATTPPATTPPTITPPTQGGNGTGNPVTAVDDDFWSTGAGQTMWQNARYLTWNDKGIDGGLKVTAVASKSAAGGTVSFDSDGTIRFNPKAGWQGKDSVAYTVADKDGSSDTGTFYVQVGKGGATMPPASDVPPAGDVTAPPSGGTGGSGNPVSAVDDHWTTKAGVAHYFNSRYLLGNDTAPDGGLAVKGIASTTAKGGTVTWDAKTGTAIYKAKPGFTGKDAVQYTVQDADGSTDTAFVNFDVLLA